MFNSIISRNINKIINNDKTVIKSYLNYIYNYSNSGVRYFGNGNRLQLSSANFQNNSDTKSNLEKYQITITDNCVNELHKLNKMENGKDKKLRVMVDTGGCSGYQYIIKIVDSSEPMTEEDVLFIKDNEKVVIDKLSLDMMEGSVIDYETSLMRSSFCVASNPNTIKSCGCKISFDLKK
ncbi:HesB/YadR/YfhF domain-containing protein [Tieghemostelium lacteum]|uniref:HesB/YadR/YfhF domain-containing protein n=1 Tax=Tieghemostelium lacteum TaxID=361077 RepID=A0A151Z9U8_TIELA|nr:HesB/YadR/YfhF domain-containing protein [Tieghemostelium lacteum]|eukprot:KYQ90719.1 HesB/YadR/YfhF domain-containing protein [Tieghemostelium lacteum]